MLKNQKIQKKFFHQGGCVSTEVDKKFHLLTSLIGRAVGRVSAAPNNARFDCKALSRNHALIWQEGDSFFIKDTKSSNGTYINNSRLSNSGDESAPTPLASGNVLQLGIEIVDNSKKVASGCIIAMVRFKSNNQNLKDQAFPIATTAHTEIGENSLSAAAASEQAPPQPDATGATGRTQHETATTPTPPEIPVNRFTIQLAQLRDMGFFYDDINVIILDSVNGNVEEATNLLSAMRD